MPHQLEVVAAVIVAGVETQTVRGDEVSLPVLAAAVAIAMPRRCRRVRDSKSRCSSAH
jgi:hypothetical protein